MAQIDLSGMSVSQLEELAQQVSAELDGRRADQRQKAIEQAREALAAAGLTFRDVARDVVSKGVRRVKKAADTAVARTQEFVNPATGAKWTTGTRGRKPDWVAEQMAKGARAENEEGRGNK